MTKNRLEAFSDGVIAILITIMVLELKVPERADIGALWELRSTLPAYALSFIFIGIYWNNHHHMLQVTDRINGRVLWANLHLLFWLSLVPFTTAWMGEHHEASLPNAAYGTVLFMAGIAYLILQHAILAVPGQSSRLAEAIGNDFKGKISAVLYLAAIALAFVNQWISDAIYVFVALMWLTPDRRIERAIHREGAHRS
jgi:uncharacterized membrane protein